jgi:hypothetical protein
MDTEGNRIRMYLGDGVYASFDGYHIWLAVNDHTNNVVALEPSVMDQLIRYRQHVADYLKELAETAGKEQEF